MRVIQFPLYCGGANLIGLYDWNQYQIGPYDRKEVIENIVKPDPNALEGYEHSDPFKLIPNDYDDFLKCLKHIFYKKEWGVVIAVTNPCQKLAAKFLEKAGWQSHGEYQKFGGNRCIVWMQNYQDLKRTLEKVDFFDEYHPEKNSRFAHPMPNEMPLPVFR